MTRKKPPATTSLVRSSAAEYLTFVATIGQGGVEAVYAAENVWLSQKMMAQIYDVDVRTISDHLKAIFSDSELQEKAVIQDFRITASDGKSYDTKHYSLSATIAVGYKLHSGRAVQFRKWATRVVEKLAVKASTMDADRRGDRERTALYQEKDILAGTRNRQARLVAEREGRGVDLGR